MKFYFIIIYLFSFSITVAAKPPVVITTFSVLENITHILAQDLVVLQNLITAGQDLHSFEPGAKELAQMKQAQLLIANGGPLEPWLPKLLKVLNLNDLKRFSPKIIYAGKNSVVNNDPHAWNSPREILKYTQVIEEALVELLPESQPLIKKRSQEFQNKIEALDLKYEKAFAQIPPEKRYLLTTHDAASYITSRYQITTLSPLGTSTVGEITTQDLTKIIRKIKELQIKTIFAEPNHHQLTIEKLAKVSGIQVGPILYLDGISAKDQPAATVEAMLQYNLDLIYKSMNSSKIKFKNSSPSY